MRLVKYPAAAVVAALAIPGVAWGQGGPGTSSGMGMGGMGMGDGWGWWMPLQGLLFMGTFFAFIIGAILLLRYFWHLGDRSHGHAPSPHARGPGALDMLDARYARGEIDREDYLQRRRDILGHAG